MCTSSSKINSTSRLRSTEVREKVGLTEWVGEALSAAVRKHRFNMNAIRSIDTVGWVIQVKQWTGWIECIDNLNPSPSYTLASMTDRVTSETVCRKFLIKLRQSPTYPNEWPIT